MNENKSNKEVKSNIENKESRDVKSNIENKESKENKSNIENKSSKENKYNIEDKSSKEDKSKKQNKLRKENTVWTVSEDYSFKPLLDLFDSYGDYDMDYYKMLLLGYVYKVMDMDKFLEFLYVHYSKTRLKDEFLKLCELYFDDCLAQDLIRIRPGAISYRQDFLDKVLSRGILRTGEGRDYEVSQALEYVYYSRICGIFLDPTSIGISPTIVDLVDYMQARNNAKTSDEIIKNLNAAFLKFFFVNTRLDLSQVKNLSDDIAGNEPRQDKNKSTIDKVKESRLKLAMKKKFLKSGQDLDSEMTVESAEFTKGIDIDSLVLDRNESLVSPSMTRSNDTVKKMVENRFGKCILPTHMVNGLELDLCRGIHKGIKLHFTRGDFDITRDNVYYSKSIKAQADANLEYYRDNELVFRRSINELREILKKKIVFDDEEDIDFATSGNLVVNRIWKNKLFNEDKIFTKLDKRERASISVDILLDASSSQMEREGQVSAQAYIIAEALTSLNIPTRVLAFSNLFNFLVINEYRDYADSRSKNTKIFDYKPSGSNRDGLALSLIAKLMDTSDYDKKILIVLSDGKPNDKIKLGTKGFFEVDGQDYMDDLAIRDTAQEVFNMKLRGKHVLGIFTGQEEDLEIEKKIFGRDFAYVKNYDRFSKLIGFYMEDILE